MKYLADSLTFSRILASLTMLTAAMLDLFGAGKVNYMAVLVIAGAAFLTDALDGIAARRWPYSQEECARIPWHTSADRSHQFDNLGDLLLYVALAALLAASDGIWWWLLLVAMVASGLINVTIERLHNQNSPWAEKIDVIFGWAFGLTLSAMLVSVAILGSPQHWGWFVLAGVFTAAALAPSKWDRLTTRPERRVVRS